MASDPQPASGTDRDGYPFKYVSEDLDDTPPVVGKLNSAQAEVFLDLRRQGLSIEAAFKEAKG